MTRFTKYVLRQLSVGMVLVTISLTFIIWLSQSLRFVEMIVNQGLSITTFIYLTILMLPSFLTQILPISLFCIITFIYSKLIADREIVVMQAAGESQYRLSKPGISLSIIVVFIIYALNLYIMPESYRKFRELQWEIRNYSHIIFKEGTFTNISGITVYVRKREAEGQLLGIMAHDKRNPKKPETWMAAKGTFAQTASGAKFIMFNGSRQTIDPSTNKLSILYFDQGILDLKEFNSSNDGAVWRHREARERTLKELLDAENLPDIGKNNIGKFIVEAHKRIANPLSAIGFTFISLAFLIAGTFSRQSQVRPIISSSIIVLSLLVSGLGLQTVVSKNLHLIFLMYLHSIIPIVIAGFFLFYPKKINRPKDNNTKSNRLSA